jgi:hypothetical protein
MNIKPKQIPFEFVIETLDSAEPIIKPMFSCHALYIKEKIMLILQNKGNEKDDGIWLATTREHHDSLKKDFPYLRSITILGSLPTA